MSELREKIARALYCASGGERTYGPWDSSGEIVVSTFDIMGGVCRLRSYFLRQADAVLPVLPQGAEPDGTRNVKQSPETRFGSHSALVIPDELWDVAAAAFFDALAPLVEQDRHRVALRQALEAFVASAGKGEEYLHRIDVLEADLAEAERLLADLLAWKKPGEDGRTRYEGDPPWQARAFLDRKNRT